MKTSLSYLPPEKQRDLRQLTEIIRREVEGCEMVILFGSYARNTYVDYDQRTEFGLRTYFMSDYDILILSDRRIGDSEQIVFDRIKDRFFENKSKDFHTRPQLINESVAEFNQQIKKSRYFYTDILEQGIKLYDSGKHRLSRPQKLNYCEIRDMAKEYYEDKFNTACQFLKGAKFFYGDGDYKMTSFNLHQATENYLRVIPMVFILYGYKEHDLKFLTDKARTYSLDVCKAFPRDTPEEERLFKLLLDAYVESRYNPNFVVSKEDIEALIPRVERLRDITEQVCATQIAEYDRRSKLENC